MCRATTLFLLLVASSPGVARSIDQCVNLERPGEIAKLTQDLMSLQIPYWVEDKTVCVDERNGEKFFAIVSRLFSDPSTTKYLKTPRTPSGVAAESFTFYEATKQAALEASLRSKGIWFEKDESGVMWYEVTNSKVVREIVFSIAEGDRSAQRSSPTVEGGARAARAPHRER